jgi:hypothetical protein
MPRYRIGTTAAACLIGLLLIILLPWLFPQLALPD